MFSALTSFFFIFSVSGDHRDLHSFPTRRSSDLAVARKIKTRTILPAGIERHRHPTRAGGPALRRQRRVAFEVPRPRRDRKSTRLNSSHVEISYAVFCLKKKKKKKNKIVNIE